MKVQGFRKRFSFQLVLALPAEESGCLKVCPDGKIMSLYISEGGSTSKGFLNE